MTIAYFATVFTDFFAEVWRIFQVPLPYLGLTFGQILIGNFIVALSIRIWKAYFGLPSLVDLRPYNASRRYERKDRNALSDR